MFEFKFLFHSSSHQYIIPKLSSPLSIGYYGNIYLLTDHFLDLYQQSSAYRKQAAMVLNEIVRGAAGIAVATEGQARGHSATLEDLKVAVVSVMEEYTSLKNWHLITVSEETDRDRQDQKVRTFPCLSFCVLS